MLIPIKRLYFFYLFSGFLDMPEKEIIALSVKMTITTILNIWVMNFTKKVLKTIFIHLSYCSYRRNSPSSI